MTSFEAIDLPNRVLNLGQCVSNGKYSQAISTNKDKMRIKIFSPFGGLREKIE